MHFFIKLAIYLNFSSLLTGQQLTNKIRSRIIYFTLVPETGVTNITQLKTWLLNKYGLYKTLATSATLMLLGWFILPEEDSKHCRWKITLTKELKKGIKSLFLPVLTLWGSSHIDHHIWR